MWSVVFQLWRLFWDFEQIWNLLTTDQPNYDSYENLQKESAQAFPSRPAFA